MTSPFSKKADELRQNDLPSAPNWLLERRASFQEHARSIETGISALQTMGAVLLQGRISTDLHIEHSELDATNTRASEALGYVSCHIVPSLHKGIPRNLPKGRGFSWTPDVALGLTFTLNDKYNYKSGKPEPTGDVRLMMHARTWGMLRLSEIESIKDLDSQRFFTSYSDQGYSRRGTSVTGICKRGQELTELQAETVLAPLASHVINYFDIINRPDLAQYQEPGNFTTR